ncbi:AAA family ATPase [Vibrio cyclitrophicus]
MSFSDEYFSLVKQLGIKFEQSNFPNVESDDYRKLCLDLDELPSDLQDTLLGQVHFDFLSAVSASNGCIYLKDNADYGIFYSVRYGTAQAIGSFGGFYITRNRGARPLQAIFHSPQRESRRVASDNYTQGFISSWREDRAINSSLSQIIRSIVDDGDFSAIDDRFWQYIDSLENAYHSVIVELFSRLSKLPNENKIFSSNNANQMLFKFDSRAIFGGLRFYGNGQNKVLSLEVTKNQLTNNQQQRLIASSKEFSLKNAFDDGDTNWKKFKFSDPSLVEELKAMLSWWLPPEDDVEIDVMTVDKPLESVSKMSAKIPLNQILFGPPGTGKTYHTIEAAVQAAEPAFYESLNIERVKGANGDQRKQLTKKYKQLAESGRIRFVTFHQSYGYEEFIEGLSAKTVDDQISYFEKKGVFREIVETAKVSSIAHDELINPTGKVWKLSIGGTHKNSKKDYCLANSLAAIGWGDTGDLSLPERNEYFNSLGSKERSSLMSFCERIQKGDLILCIDSLKSVEAIGVVQDNYMFKDDGLPVESGYCHQIPVNWLVKGQSIDFRPLNNGTSFSIPTCYELHRMTPLKVLEYVSKLNNTVDDFSVEETQSSNERYVLVIDEINRGNISKIFGELITLIEPSKRKGAEEELEVTLPYSGDTFSVPDNLHIIGTMNTADRSLAMMDTALRRRFDFKEMMPKPELFKDHVIEHQRGDINLQELLTKLNQRIEVLYDREHTLGHAFLFPAYNLAKESKHAEAFEELQSAFKNKIIPLLEEYFYEDWNKIRLVLGDSLKSDEALRFLAKQEDTYSDLFGSNHDLDLYEDKKVTYLIKPFEGDETPWVKPSAYIGIYQQFASESSESEA